ncbi:hypothetical protein ABID08_002869 [Rhizobium binae]|uniref:Uncharacterized protein n=1 Tax=Rhizobium binae TaxID=1138190 RepID=A0ABV2MGA5_9HYPH
MRDEPVAIICVRAASSNCFISFSHYDQGLPVGGFEDGQIEIDGYCGMSDRSFPRGQTTGNIWIRA